MPNYKFNYKHHDEIKGAVRAMMYKYVECVRGGFPLTFDEIQEFVLPRDLAEQVNTLARRGVVMGKKSSFDLRFRSNEELGLKRDTIVNVYVNQGIYYSDFERERTLFDYIPEDKRAPLVKWINETTRAMRLRDLVVSTVETFMTWCEHTTQVVENWPYLVSLIKDPKLKARYYNPPTRREKYSLDYRLTAEFRKRMKIAEAMLNTASMFVDESVSAARVQAAVAEFKKLPTDGDF
jgi:hypothetical protein